MRRRREPPDSTRRADLFEQTCTPALSSSRRASSARRAASNATSPTSNTSSTISAEKSARSVGDGSPAAASMRLQNSANCGR